MNGTSALEVHVEGVAETFRATGCVVDERLSAPFSCEVQCVALRDGERVPLGSLDLVGRKAEVVFSAGSIERRFAGRVALVGDAGGTSVLVVTPSIADLALTRDYRVFVDTSATEALEAVLGEHGIRLDLRVARAASKRPQIVQSFESDLDFAQRLLAEEGMSWVARGTDPDTLLIQDAPSTFDDGGVSLEIVHEAGLLVGQAVHEARLERRAVPDKVSLRDFDFTHPHLDLAAATGGAGEREHFEYPGGYTTPEEGRDLAEIRLAERRGEDIVLTGEATAPGLEAGTVFAISSAPLETMAGRWLLLSVRHTLRLVAGPAERSYLARFGAVPAPAGFRPSREVSTSRSAGPTTATVAGASGQEIAVDDLGRTRALLRWDRRAVADERASTHARVTQPQLAGAIFNPRVGWEELVAFTSDRTNPIVLGRLFNGAQPPPTGLPGGKVETHFGTLTTPRGATGNALKVSDTAGAEQLAMQASGDFNEQTDNDKVVEISVDHLRTIGGARKLMVAERFATQVAGASSLTVGAVRKVCADSDYSLSAGFEDIAVLGARIFRVGGDYLTKTPTLVRVVVGKKGEAPIEHQSVFTRGMSTVVVGGAMSARAALAESVAVAGQSLIVVSGPQTVSCNRYGLNVKGVYAESQSSRTVNASGKYAENFRAVDFHWKGGSTVSGSEVAIEAKSKLTIKAGGVTVTMTPGSIEIQGDFEGMTPSAEEGNHRYG